MRNASHAVDLSATTAVDRRLKLLIAAHLAAGIVPGAGFLIPADVRFLPLMWALASVSFAQLMLLAFWFGMGTNRGIKRMVGTFLGTAYVGFAPLVLGEFLSPSSRGRAFMMGSLARCPLNGAVVLLLAGVFFLVRRWSAELRYASDSKTAFPAASFQYSILHLLVITSVAAVVFGLVQTARSGDAQFTAAHVAAFFGLIVLAFLLNLLCAVWGTLGAGPIRLRVSLVFLVAILLGTALALASGAEQWAWWLSLSHLLSSVIPTAIVIASLLVVRWCGYRLTAKARPVACCRNDHDGTAVIYARR